MQQNALPTYKKKVKIKSINDFTAEKVEIEVQLVPGEDAEKTIQALYAFTNCEVSVSCRTVVIHGGRPMEMDVKSILQHNTRRLVQLLRKELQNEQKRLEDFKDCGQPGWVMRALRRSHGRSAYLLLVCLFSTMPLQESEQVTLG